MSSNVLNRASYLTNDPRKIGELLVLAWDYVGACLKLLRIMKFDLLKLTKSYCTSLEFLCRIDIHNVKLGQHL